MPLCAAAAFGFVVVLGSISVKESVERALATMWAFPGREVGRSGKPLEQKGQIYSITFDNPPLSNLTFP